MEQILLEKIKKLGIKEFENFNSLNLMDGNYLNIECTLPNGDKTKILDNDTQYYAKQIDIEGSDKCYGVAANEKFIAVYKYGCNGENAELVLWKKYNFNKNRERFLVLRRGAALVPMGQIPCTTQ